MTAPPSPVPVLPGNTWTTLRDFRRVPLRLFQDASRLGPVVRLPIRRRTLHLLCAPEPAQRLLGAPVEGITKGTRGGRLLLRTLGPGLLTTDGPPWIARRKLAQPHFRKEALGTWVEVVRRHADALVDRWVDADGAVDVVATANHTALGIVGEAMLGVDLGADDAVVAHALDAVLHGFLRFTTSPIEELDRWPLPSAFRYRRAIRDLQAVVDRVVADRRRREARDDVLAAWIAAHDRGELDADDLRAEVLTLLLAGHETTANAVAWTLGLLAGEPEALEEVTAAADAGDEATLDAALSEGMRLYPPAWVVARALVDPLDVGPAVLPAGSFAFVGIHALHRHPDLWPQPDAFRLDRWSVPPARGSYLPFGGGPRRCIGEHFARLEAREILAATLRRARPVAVGPLPEPEPSVTLRPRGGLLLRFAAR